MDDGFGHWLAGFIDGEGCFVIYCGKGNWKCAFTLEVRADEAPILEEIVARTGVGVIRHNRARKNSKPQAAWGIQSRADCLALVALLDAHPLRAKKAKDYAIWREAVLRWATVKRTNVLGTNSEAWEDIAALRQRLVEGRRYAGRT